MQESDKTLVTVVIPVYNMEKYVARCIQSVLDQIYGNLDIIIVNDGSTDSSKDIIEEYAKRDERIRVITTANKGLSAARNIGIIEGRGEYIAFVDADDYISREYVDILLKTCKDNGVSISQCFYYNINEDCNEDVFVSEIGSEYKVTLYKEREMLLSLYNHMMLPSTLTWTKLYKKDLFCVGKDTLDVMDKEHLAFPEGRIYEDDYVVYRLFHKAGKMAVVDKKLYAYRKNPNGITNGRYTIKGLDLMASLEARIEYYKKAGDKGIINLTYRRYYYELCRTIYKVKNNKDNIPNWKECIKDLNRKKRSTLIKLLLIAKFEDKSVIKTQLIKGKCIYKMIWNN